MFHFPMQEEVDLDISHQKMLQERFWCLGLDISEYSFANVYLFRKKHAYTLNFFDDLLFIKGTTYDGKRYLMPTQDIRKHPQEKLEKILQEGEFFFLFLKIGKRLL